MRAALVIAGITAGVFGTGCVLLCPQTDCDSPAVIVCVTDALTGAPLDAAVVELVGQGQPYTLDASSANCRTLYHAGIDSARFDVRADGYAAASLEVQVPRDTCGDQIAQRRDVALQRLGSAARPLVTDGPAPEECGN